LKTSDGVASADVDGEIESLAGDRPRELRKAEAKPPFTPVNSDGGVPRKRGDIKPRMRARSNSEVRDAAGIGGVRRVAALFGQHAVDGD
jgi:hypothetical protein